MSNATGCLCEGSARFYASYAIRGKKWKYRPCRGRGVKRLLMVHLGKVICDKRLCTVHRKRKIAAEKTRYGLEIIEGYIWDHKKGMP